MNSLMAMFVRAISVGVHPQLSEEKKLAIQLATVDGYWTFITLFGYFAYTLLEHKDPHTLIYGIALIFVGIGVFSFFRRHYDLARFLINFVGMSIVFLTADGAQPYAGYEYYYLTAIAVPFIIFTHDEWKKGLLLTSFSTGLFLFQQFAGTGIFMEVQEAPPEERIAALLFIVSYFILMFTVGRWQIRARQRELAHQQQELIHSASLVALGEMAAGIAHEINNPLQALSLQLTVLKELEKEEEIQAQMNRMEDTLQRMGKLVRGLKHLSRKDSIDFVEKFTSKDLIESVMNISTDRFDRKGVAISFKGQSEHNFTGHLIQMSQVLINLLNNSIQAVKDLPEKWVEVEVKDTLNSVQILVTDSGNGIEDKIIDQIMKPFFTTKGPKEGTGLGLSISHSIVQKHGGLLYYDRSYPNTRFVIELPKAYMR